MIHITKKEQCCGCNACVQVCPVSCIEMKVDLEGFYYPVVEQIDKCIKCGKCERVCPCLNKQAENTPLLTFAVQSNQEELRMQSSSGGFFTELSLWVLQQQGVVFGARFTKEWTVEHAYTETVDGLAYFRGSKYVQSHLGDSFKQVKAFLQAGRWVLFSGTSCQIAALSLFLKTKPERLLTVEVVCHGVPSERIWRSYLMELTDQSVSKITDIDFRNKKTGWKNYSFVCNWQTHRIQEVHKQNNYMKAYLSDSLLRPVCYRCPSKSFAAGSDFTLADYWGVHSLQPELDDDLGIGIAFVHTSKAQQVLDLLPIAKYPLSASFEQIVRYNHSLAKPVNPPLRLKRYLFYVGLSFHLPFSFMVNILLKKRGIIGWFKHIGRKG